MRGGVGFLLRTVETRSAALLPSCCCCKESDWRPHCHREDAEEGSSIFILEKGDILMKKGDIGSEMHIIKSGKILLKDIEVKGRKYEDMELTTGDFFGERAVLESEPRAATAVAVEKSTMYCISKDSFVKHIGSMDKLKRDATYFRLLVSYSKNFLILDEDFFQIFLLCTHILMTAENNFILRKFRYFIFRV